MPWLLSMYDSAISHQSSQTVVIKINIHRLYEFTISSKMLWVYYYCVVLFADCNMML